MNNLENFNMAMNIEFMSATHGAPVSMEELESMTLRSMLVALGANVLETIKVSEVRALIEDLDNQGRQA